MNASANFCWSCGAAQHDATSPDTIAVPVTAAQEQMHQGALRAPAGLVWDVLVIATGPGAGSRFEMKDETMTVGRHEASSVVLDDVSVSRHHGIFTRTSSGRVTLRDLNSLNGTYVNGSRTEEIVLHSGDEVQIGKFKLIFWQAIS